RHDPPRSGADRSRGLDVLLLHDHEGGTAHDAGKARREGDPDRDHRRGQARPQDAGDGDEHDDGGEGQHDVDHALHDVIDDTEVVTRNQAHQAAQHQGDADRDDADLERDPRAVDDPAQDVAAKLVRAEEIPAPGWEEAPAQSGRRSPPRGGEGRSDEGPRTGWSTRGRLLGADAGRRTPRSMATAAGCLSRMRGAREASTRRAQWWTRTKMSAVKNTPP